ncbi:hypothetical protein [Erythrobacter sp. YT30]|uniref:hypothetical protein n=1 Tax=Erythrobacter sp. YT30 TaxID=1735012 RepID=UPI00076C0F7B|nr:hypothetical protein [Erythrobacter sp. YT30]KWV92802.1 hypothetical protein AUC45_01215 [Erythrobacter sp. YT30]
MIAQPQSGASSALFLGLRPEGEVLNAARIETFIQGVIGTGVELTRETPLRDGAIYQFAAANGAPRAKAMVKRRDGTTALAVLITSDRGLSDEAALRMVGNAVRSIAPRSSLARDGAALKKASGSRDARLFVGVKFRPASMPAGGSGVTRYNLLLLPDGTAYSGVPPKGELRPSRASLETHAQRRVGNWRQSDQTIQVQWPQRTGPFANETYKIGQNSLELRGTKLSEVACPPGAVRLSGEYQATTSQSVGPGIGVPVQAGIYSSRAMRFTNDGRIYTASQSAVSGRTSGSSGAGTANSGENGRYRWQNCRLELEYAGQRSAHTAFFWPGEGRNLLVIDGRTFTRR